MIRFKSMRLLFTVLIVLFLLPQHVAAMTATTFRAHQDYQFQYDSYRKRLSDFRIALNQYQQFKSLASQQDAIEKSRLLLGQRAVAAKSYLIFLNEMLGENPSIAASELAIYRATISSQTSFLDQHAVLSTSVASLEDAQKTSESFITNYETLGAGYRQIIVGIELGYLNYFAERFSKAAVVAQNLVLAAKPNSTPEKNAILDRWLLSLSNKYTLYQQKANIIRTSIPKITGEAPEQERAFIQVQSVIAQARQDLVEGASYLKELETALTYD